MNSLDFIILCMIFISVLYSFFRGLIREVFSLLSVSFGFFSAVIFYPLVANQFFSWINNLLTRNILSFIFIFIGVSVIISLIGWLIRSVIKICKLGILDRILGVLVGFLKGVLFGILLLLVLIYFLPNAHPLLSQSKLSPYFVMLGEIPIKLLPEKIKVKIESKKRALIASWDGESAQENNRSGQKSEMVPQKGD